MKKEGNGGRGNGQIDNPHLLDGVLAEDEIPAGLHHRRCASRFCGKFFWSRQDGDNYCCEQCDLDEHPQYRPSERFGGLAK
jgi:hypothetical protein